jgi:hypothetical protein
MKRMVSMLIVGCATLFAIDRASAQVTVTVDPGASWLGFMNVFELPANGGGYVFGSPWGTADLKATFSGPTLTLGPAPISTGDSFWYQNGTGGPGAAGNKTMAASMYVEQTGPLSGQQVTFTGRVVSNSLIAPYTTVAFIRDFAPDYSSNTSATIPLTSGVFSVTLATNGAPGRHVQFGFETTGPNVWPTDILANGTVQIVAVPEPSSIALLAIGISAVGWRRCRR